MKETTRQKVDDLLVRYPKLAPLKADLERAVQVLCDCYHQGGKLLVCGNGGSAADSEHIVGELMKGFLKKREIRGVLAEKIRKAAPQSANYLLKGLQGALPAISLCNEVALNSAFANDQAPDLAFAQLVLGFGNAGDVLLGISTSGNSTNVLHAFEVAKAKGLKTLALTGATGGKIKAQSLADVVLCAPDSETYRIQEYHLPIYHMLCIAVEEEFFGEA